MKAKVVFESANEADLYMSDGGVATFHHNGEGILTTYYESRFIPEETKLEEDQTMWDFLGEGKTYTKEWPGQHEITDEMIEDAVVWLCPIIKTTIVKIYPVVMKKIKLIFYEIMDEDISAISLFIDGKECFRNFNKREFNSLDIYSNQVIEKEVEEDKIPFIIELLDLSYSVSKISCDEDDVYVECPHCNHCESHPIDEQRHHLQTFKILDWLEDVDGQNEYSLMKCGHCNKEFELDWDYDNKEEDED